MSNVRRCDHTDPKQLTVTEKQAADIAKILKVKVAELEAGYQLLIKKES